MTVVVWDHLTMFSDEVKYVWKKEKLWRKSHWISFQNDIFTVLQPFGFLLWFASIEFPTLSSF